MASRPLRILAVVPSLGGGGAEKHVERLASSVPRERATIDVAVVRRGGSFERFLPKDVSVIELRPRPLRSGTLETLASLPRLRRELASGRWDAVIAFLDRPSLAALVARATLPRERRPALLLSVQADPEPVFAEDPLGPVLRASMRHLFARADAVLAISEGVADRIRAIAPRLAPIVVPNACVDDALRASLVPLPARSHEPLVVACGRLAPQKGFDALLDAFARLHRRLPDARLRILGQGPLLEPLRERARSLGVESSVEFAGFVDHPAREIAKASVFCLSSRFEGLGMVVVEAMAAGTPVVSTDCPFGPAEILDHGRYGWLVPVEDPAALADALHEALTDTAKAAEFARLGLGRAEAYEARAIALRYVEVVERVLGARAASSA